MAVPGGPHVDVQHLKLDKVARERPMVAKLLCDYLLFVEHLPKLALELCTAALRVGANSNSSGSGAALAAPSPAPMGPGRPGLPLAPTAGPPLPPAADRTQQQVGIRNADDWWWKARLAKANYQLGLLREAERWYKAALFDGEALHAHGRQAPGHRFQHYHTGTIMELAKVYKRMDQPLTACELFTEALEANPLDHLILLCSARLYDELHDPHRAFDLYTSILRLDSSCVEAISCTAAFFFYERNQPELALRFYRRLMQMGVQSCEVWNNMGLCAFFTSQFDFALSCLERALTMAVEATERADIYYNIGHVGVGLGDLAFAQRGFRLAVAADPTHGEALNNLAVLALQQEQRALAAADSRGGAKPSEEFHQEATQLLEMAKAAAPELPEALYNSAVLSYQQGELESAHELLSCALEAYPDHAESVQLLERIMKHLSAL
ncbi:TRP protein for flagellar function [Strigomonas culicis]|uniref:TRP protein for flagellar function n=1 Tax=Strigomonas culicis TaxID=28005 RepID=S9TWC6_9TRYP|nr:TRP protein for flagellar function [Strigomonas culicis]|eukprot:EPY22782.1 TRP protein for flagellar function [Strigomonas culicis]